MENKKELERCDEIRRPFSRVGLNYISRPVKIITVTSSVLKTSEPKSVMMQTGMVNKPPSLISNKDKPKGKHQITTHPWLVKNNLETDQETAMIIWKKTFGTYRWTWQMSLWQAHQEHHRQRLVDHLSRYVHCPWEDMKFGWKSEEIRK